jgi:periplasmic divalent cation tolerance protein
MDYTIGYITTQTPEQAKAIAQTLLDKKLIACANITREVESMYRWEGKIETTTESVLVIKTTSALQEKVIEAVKTIHQYECPCIVFYAIEAGNPAYLKWIESSV